MAVTRPDPCHHCGKQDCHWHNGTWKADWMRHDPEGYYEWAMARAVKAVREEREERRRSLMWWKRRRTT